MPLSSKKILVVDDESLLAESIVSLLSTMGAEARQCGDGREAALMLAKWAPDVILSDYRMPVSDGFDLLGLVKEKKVRCPVVWMSGYVNKTMFREAWRMGVYDVLEKPVHADTLVNSLCAAMEGSPPPSMNGQGRFLTGALYEMLEIEVPKELFDELRTFCDSLGKPMGKLALELLTEKARSPKATSQILAESPRKG